MYIGDISWSIFSGERRRNVSFLDYAVLFCGALVSSAQSPNGLPTVPTIACWRLTITEGTTTEARRPVTS